MSGLAGREQQQQPPQIVAVLHLRKAARLGAAAEAVQGAEGHVFLVGGQRRPAPQAGAGACHQERKVAFPKLSDCGAVAGLEQVKPMGHGAIVGHAGVLGDCGNGDDEPIVRPPSKGANRFRTDNRQGQTFRGNYFGFDGRFQSQMGISLWGKRQPPARIRGYE